MSDIEIKISEVKALYEEVLDIIEKLDTENYDTYFNYAKEQMLRAKMLEKELKNSISENILQKIDKEIIILSKQIEKSYDNMLNRFNDKKKELEIEIQNQYNRKKLLVYSR